jgi:hypothetical protein
MRLETSVSPTGGSSLGRGAVAKHAGMSGRQRKTALRVASVPKDKFEAQVESENPPTVTDLSKQGTLAAMYGLPADYLGSRTPEQHQEATRLIGIINHVLREEKTLDFSLAIPGVGDYECDELFEKIDAVRVWLMGVEKGLCHGKAA